MSKIYLVRQHLQVGDELILAAFLDRPRANKMVAQKREKTGTRSFDVLVLQEGTQREGD